MGNPRYLPALYADDTQAIFANLEELCRCATVLLELMDREGERVTVLAHAFIQVTPFFKLYAFYCRNYERALSTLATCRSKVPALSDFLNRQAALPQCRGLSLESYLIKPVQRLTKYPLFWKDLLKSVPHAHPQRAMLEKAEELVRTVSMAVNQVSAAGSQPGTACRLRRLRVEAEGRLLGSLIWQACRRRRPLRARRRAPHRRPLPDARGSARRGWHQLRARRSPHVA